MVFKMTKQEDKSEAFIMRLNKVKRILKWSEKLIASIFTYIFSNAVKIIDRNEKKMNEK